MIVHPPTAILFVTDRDDSSLQPLLSYLQNIGHLKLTIEPQMVKDLSPYDVVVTENTAAFAGDNEQLLEQLRPVPVSRKTHSVDDCERTRR